MKTQVFMSWNRNAIAGVMLSQAQYEGLNRTMIELEERILELTALIRLTILE